ncbi:unnamed protein product [Protopolystoma xenopodis]|uniref:NR LBD domain-containing protein n=1 Tax=Protopolystoma xenopodis TaxID=117903 RepID=A0A448XK09_9PLAT|nr:unnamed protein product [Protopolystoma xenopodis]
MKDDKLDASRNCFCNFVQDKPSFGSGLKEGNVLTKWKTMAPESLCVPTTATISASAYESTPLARLCTCLQNSLAEIRRYADMVPGFSSMVRSDCDTVLKLHALDLMSFRMALRRLWLTTMAPTAFLEPENWGLRDRSPSYRYLELVIRCASDENWLYLAFGPSNSIRAGIECPPDTSSSTPSSTSSSTTASSCMSSSSSSSFSSSSSSSASSANSSLSSSCAASAPPSLCNTFLLPSDPSTSHLIGSTRTGNCLFPGALGPGELTNQAPVCDPLLPPPSSTGPMNRHRLSHLRGTTTTVTTSRGSGTPTASGCSASLLMPLPVCPRRSPSRNHGNQTSRSGIEEDEVADLRAPPLPIFYSGLSGSGSVSGCVSESGSDRINLSTSSSSWLPGSGSGSGCNGAAARQAQLQAWSAAVLVFESGDTMSLEEVAAAGLTSWAEQLREFGLRLRLLVQDDLNTIAGLAALVLLNYKSVNCKLADSGCVHQVNLPTILPDVIEIIQFSRFKSGLISFFSFQLGPVVKAIALNATRSQLSGGSGTRFF